jgi:uncharacterized protein (TIGR02145 family)
LKNRILIVPVIFVCLLLILAFSCRKEDKKNNKPAPPATITDIDGNVYHTIVIGDQAWLQENLKVTHYRNGDSISKVTDNSIWSNLTAGAFCNYQFNQYFDTIYGKIYNWYAVHDSRKICPAGWHVATDAEWTTLVNYLGGGNVAGGKLKESGTSHWKSPNIGATNETGFTALPGGMRYNSGSFNWLYQHGYWWTSTEINSTSAWFWRLDYTVSNAERMNFYDKNTGMSVRCVMD